MSAYIQVCVTHTRLFRAKVTPKDDPISRYEVTVGGREWKKGKGSEYREEILSKCRGTITKLQHEIEEA